MSYDRRGVENAAILLLDVLSSEGKSTYTARQEWRRGDISPGEKAWYRGTVRGLLDAYFREVKS